MITKQEIEELSCCRASTLDTLACGLGYGEQTWRGDPAGEFFEDNPGAIEAVLTWVLEHGCNRNGDPIEDEDDWEDD